MLLSEQKSGETAIGTQAVKRLVMGGGVAAGIVVYGYQLLSRQPDQSFGLLRAWGPGFIGALLALYFVYDLLKLAVGYIGKLAQGVQDLSLAVGKIAEKDDRQYEEMRLVTQYSAQRANRAIEILEQQQQQLGTIVGILDELKKR